VDGTDSGSCVLKDFSISGIEPTLSATIVLVIGSQFIICIDNKINSCICLLS
jgi:hypothetical protein